MLICLFMEFCQHTRETRKALLVTWLVKWERVQRKTLPLAFWLQCLIIWGLCDLKAGSVRRRRADIALGLERLNLYP